MKLKKKVSIILAFAMLLSVVNITVAFTQGIESETTNTATRDLEVYVTDGYIPVCDAIVSIDDKIARTDENGIAVLDDIAVSDKVYKLVVTSDVYGERTNDLFILNDGNSDMAKKFTVSYWKPDSDVSAATYATSTYATANDNGWSYLNVPDDPYDYSGYTNAVKAFVYNKYIYVVYEDSASNAELKAYNPSNNTWSTLTSIANAKSVLCNGALYTYSVASGHVQDDWLSETYLYSLYKYDMESGEVTCVRSGYYGGTDYNCIIANSDTVFFGGGEYYESFNLADTTELYSYSTTQGENSFEDTAFGGSKMTGVWYKENNNVYMFDSGKRVTKISSKTFPPKTEWVSSLAQDVYYEGQSADVVDGKIYFIGGTGAENSVRIYDIASKNWSTGKNCSVGRVDASTVVVNGKIYVMGGNANENVLEVYDTVNNTWSNEGSISHNIASNCAVEYEGKIYAFFDGSIIGIYNIENSGVTVSSSPIELNLQNIENIDTYDSEALAIDNAGKVYEWGRGYYADGTDTMRVIHYPKLIEGITDAVQVSCGKNYNLVLDKNGDVWGWGSNSNNPMGDVSGKLKTATKLSCISNVKQAKAGNGFSIFLKNDGTIWGVGKNDKGQLGTSNITSTSTPVQITSKNDFEKVSVGEGYVAAIASDGIYVWGDNSYGQLGINPKTATITPGTIHPLNINLEDGESFVDISAGGRFAIALTNLGNVYAWGDNANGELGQGNKTQTYSPVKISTISNISNISAGTNTALAVTADKNVYGWGYSKKGNLGLTVSGSITKPTKVTSLNDKDISIVSCADGFSAVVSEMGRVYTFGNNENGSLGVY